MASFHFLSNTILCKNHIFIYSSTDGHLDCFHILAIVNNCNEHGVHVSFWIRVFVFFRKKLRSEISRPSGSSVFNFLRTLYSILHSGYTSLHSNQHCMRVLFSPHPLTLLSLVFFYHKCEVIAHGFDEHFLMISNVEDFFMCLLAICMSSLKKYLFIYSAHFLNVLLAFQILNCRSPLFTLNLGPLSYIFFVNIFSCSVGFFIVLVVVSCTVKSFLVWYSPVCSFCPPPGFLRRYFKKYC